MKVLVIDNYDSFTYNLVHYLEPFCSEVTVVFNDQFSLDLVESFDKVVISPGPGLPKNAGILMAFLERYHNKKPILGVCLGLQAIVEYFGGELYNLTQVIHGKETNCHLLGEDVLFDGFPNQFKVGRYHSWAVNRESLPKELKITAEDPNGIIMAVKHIEFPISAVQFHPESIMTTNGKRIIENWLSKSK